jgi:hypothetical protein
MSTKTHRSPKIAPGYSAKEWRALKLDPDTPHWPDWEQAIAMFDARIRQRFFAPVDALIDFEAQREEKTVGFTILAIDCLVIETLQGFRQGIVKHNGKSETLFVNFLIGWDVFKRYVPPNGDAEKLAKRIYSDCRCALLHSGATDGELRVGVTGPVFRFKDGHVQGINRTSFHSSLRSEFDGYLAALRTPDGGTLRRNFKKKMDAIAGGGDPRAGSEST